MRRAIVPLEELQRRLEAGDPDTAAPSSFRRARRAVRGEQRAQRKRTRGRRRTVASRDLELRATGAVQGHPRGELESWRAHIETIMQAAGRCLERPEGVSLFDWSRTIVLNLREIRRSAELLLTYLDYEDAQR